MQNIAAWLISGAWRCDHITPVLRRLHWLRIRRRVEFKIDTLGLCAPVAVWYGADLPGLGQSARFGRQFTSASVSRLSIMRCPTGSQRFRRPCFCCRWARMIEQSTTESMTTQPISWTIQAVTEYFFVQAGYHGELRLVLNALTRNPFTYLLIINLL